MPRVATNHQGQVFGRLTLLERCAAPERITTLTTIKSAWWKWECTCGNVGVSLYASFANLKDKSCGCVKLSRKEALRKLRKPKGRRRT